MYVCQKGEEETRKETEGERRGLPGTTAVGRVDEGSAGPVDEANDGLVDDVACEPGIWRAGSKEARVSRMVGRGKHRSEPAGPAGVAKASLGGGLFSLIFRGRVSEPHDLL